MTKGVVSFILLALIAVGAIIATASFAAPKYVLGEFTRLAAQNQPTAYVVLRIDAAAVQRDRLEHIADQMGAVLRAEGVRYTGRTVIDDAARLQLVDIEDIPRARQALARLANAAQGAIDTLAFTERENGVIEARLPFAVSRDLIRVAAAQAAQVVQRRVNPDNVANISVRAIEDDQILVEAIGETDTARLRQRIGSTGQLTFHLVHDHDDPASPPPPGVIIAAGHPAFGAGPEYVAERPNFTGVRLARVEPTRDPATEQIVLSFALDTEGTRIFCRVTRDHMGRRFAILLDGQVITAPRINEPICSGEGQITGNFTAESANALALLLRAGALPSPIILVEEGVRPPAR